MSGFARTFMNQLLPGSKRRKQIAGDLLRRAFDGSAKNLVLGALAAQPASGKDLAGYSQNAGRIFAKAERPLLMSTLHLVAAQPWVERLGWTLVHFLWQGVLISALYAVARQWMARSSSPNTRYLLACGALAAMMIVPFVTLSWIQPSNPVPVSTGFMGRVPFTAFAFTTVATASVRATVSSVQPESWLPWVVMVWIAGSLALWIRLLGGWVIAARMRSSQLRVAPPDEDRHRVSCDGEATATVRPRRASIRGSLAGVGPAIRVRRIIPATSFGFHDPYAGPGRTRTRFFQALTSIEIHDGSKVLRIEFNCRSKSVDADSTIKRGCLSDVVAYRVLCRPVGGSHCPSEKTEEQRRIRRINHGPTFKFGL